MSFAADTRFAAGSLAASPGGSEINDSGTMNRLQAEVVCRCLGVTDVEVRTAIETCSIETVKEIGHCTGAGQGCTVCHRRLRGLLANTLESRSGRLQSPGISPLR